MSHGRGCKEQRVAQKLLEWPEDLQFIRQSHEYYTEERKGKLGRVVCWFSAGAASAVAAKLAILKYRGVMPVHVVYCDTRGEHPSNKQFLAEVQEWLGQDIEILCNRYYKNHFDVFVKERYLVGPEGAKCSKMLKQKLRKKYEDVERDIQIFGYCLEEVDRAEDFRLRSMDVYLEVPLIDKGLDKGDCLGILQEMGIQTPAMYLPQKSGAPYPNNNCIGCVKGGCWYWNKIRIDFPDHFDRMVAIEEMLGRCCVKHKGKRTYLKDLPPDAGYATDQADWSCGPVCQVALEELRDV